MILILCLLIATPEREPSLIEQYEANVRKNERLYADLRRMAAEWDKRWPHPKPRTASPVGADGPIAPRLATDDQNSLSRVFDSVVASSEVIGPPSPVGFETGARMVARWAEIHAGPGPRMVGEHTEELLTVMERYRRVQRQ